MSPARRMRQQEKDENDPHNLYDRFVLNQKLIFADAYAEVCRGKKRSCWLWFILPTAPYIVDGIERGSSMNKEFCLRGDDAVREYLKFERDGLNLRKNYIRIVSAMENQLKHGNTMTKLLGSLDDVKGISSIKLFERVASEIGDTELAELCASILEYVKMSDEHDQESDEE